MFTSIFRKLLTTYLAIIIAAITALSILISHIYGSYIFEEKNRTLLRAAYQINQLAQDLESGRISDGNLQIALNSLGTVTDAKIYLVRVDKKALASPDTLEIGENLDENFLLEDLGKIVDGQTVFRHRQYSARFQMEVVFTGIPWKTADGIEGAILLFSPVSHITDNIAQMNLILWIIAITAILVSAVVIYFNSLRISRPIKKMEAAARKLAEGENTEDILIKDRDEIGMLAQSFNFMKKQLAATEKMRREFIANVSHDLRTPLTSINGFVEGMLDGLVKPENYRKYLLIIHEETTRLTRMTGEILQLAKLQSGSMKLNKLRINAKRLVESVLDAANALMAEKSISCTVACGENIEVFADEDKIRQVLVNLIGNAVQYNREEGTIAITVTESPQTICFSVKDSGIGIPEEELPYIFEKFYRVDKSRQGSQGGTGLGLNIVKSLVELHGGAIRAISRPGAGTEMVFELPK